MADPDRMLKSISIIIVIAILLVLLTPIPSSIRDGGTTRYSAIAYTVTNYRRFWEEDGYYGRLVGTRVRVFGITVFNNARFEPYPYQSIYP